jgi:hypothetical protein
MATKNSNGRKIDQRTIKYTNFYHLKNPVKFTQIGIFGLKIYHLATLISSRFVNLRNPVYNCARTLVSSSMPSLVVNSKSPFWLVKFILTPIKNSTAAAELFEWFLFERFLFERFLFKRFLFERFLFKRFLFKRFLFERFF